MERSAPLTNQATLPQRFEEQVIRTPQRNAIVHDGLSLTYGELNERANRLAHLLIASGIGTDQIVALALPRSLDMVIGILAVLKAGSLTCRWIRSIRRIGWLT